MPKCVSIQELELAVSWLRKNYSGGYEAAMACQAVANRLEAELNTRKQAKSIKKLALDMNISKSEAKEKIARFF